jgi:hypothetical protein
MPQKKSQVLLRFFSQKSIKKMKKFSMTKAKYRHFRGGGIFLTAFFTPILEKT